MPLDRRSLLQNTAVLASIGTLLASGPALAAGDLYVIAEAIAKPGRADALRNLLVPFVAKVRTEPGCRRYMLLEVDGEPGRFLTFETWSDKSALDNHMTTPHIKELIPKLGDVLAKPFTQTFLSATVA